MPRLRPSLIALSLALLATGFESAVAQDGDQSSTPARNRAGAQSAQARTQVDPAKMEILLDKWATQSGHLRTLEVLIYRVDKTPGFDEDHYEGHAAFRNPQLAFLDFRRVKTKLEPDPKDKTKKRVVPVIDPRTKKALSVPHESIICGGSEVWHYRWDVKQIFIYSLDKNQQRRALEEGPLPFLFNMKVGDAHRRYEMSLQWENDKLHFVVVKPKLQEDKESFTTAWVFLDRQYLLPTRIVLFLPDGKSTQDYYMTKTWANQPVKDDYFRGVVPPGKDWKVERNPGANEPARASGPPRRRSAGGQDARRPQPAGTDQPR
jgi:TIGR03009 family protein